MKYCYEIKREDNFFFNGRQALEVLYSSQTKAVEMIENLLITGLHRDFGVVLTKDDFKSELIEGNVIQRGNYTVELKIGDSSDKVIVDEKTGETVDLKNKIFYVKIGEYYIKYICSQKVIV